MKVTLKTRIWDKDKDEYHEAGETVDLLAEKARFLIDAGHAEEVKATSTTAKKEE